MLAFEHETPGGIPDKPSGIHHTCTCGRSSHVWCHVAAAGRRLPAGLFVMPPLDMTHNGNCNSGTYSACRELAHIHSQHLSSDDDTYGIVTGSLSTPFLGERETAPSTLVVERISLGLHGRFRDFLRFRTVRICHLAVKTIRTCSGYSVCGIESGSVRGLLSTYV